MPWRRERLPTPVFWPGEFPGLYSPWRCKELNMTERLSLSYFPKFDHWVRKICWRRGRLPTPVFLGFPGSSDDKESTCSEGDLDSILGLERSPGGGRGNLLRYSCLENPHGQRSLAGYLIIYFENVIGTHDFGTKVYSS